MRNWTEKFAWKSYLTLAALMLLALGFRLFLMRYRFAAAFDEISYLKLAAQAQAQGPGGALHLFWTPLLPWMTALLALLVPSLETAGRWVSLLSGMALLPMIYLFARHYYGEKPAFNGTMLLALVPGWAFLQTGVLTEPLYTFMATAGMLSGWRAMNGHKWLWGATAGAAFGLAYLTRPEGIGFIMVFAGIVLLLLAYRHFKLRVASRELLITGGAAVLAFVLAAAPYWIFLKTQSGHWTISGKTANLQGEAYAMMQKNDEVDIYRLLSDDNSSQPIDQLYHEGVPMNLGSGNDAPVVRVTLPMMFRKYLTNFNKVLKEGLPTALSTVIMVFMTLGLLGRPWKQKQWLRELYLLTFAGFFWFVVVPVFHISERYFIPFLPFCFMWAGQGMTAFEQWFRDTFPEVHIRWSLVLVWTVVLAGLLLPGLGKELVKKPYSDRYWDIPVEQKIAGQWLRPRMRPGDGIMNRFHTVDLYAGNTDITQSVDIPLNSLDRISAYARHKKCRFLMLNERYRMDNPNLDSLFHRPPPAGLVKIYDETPAPGLRTLIFEWMDSAETEADSSSHSG